MISQIQQDPSGREIDLLEATAFLGFALLPVADVALCVYVLCWPIVPNAWRSLAQAWESVGGWRAGNEARGNPQASSWIAACAPQFGSPFAGAAAEESTVAAILSRTAMLAAVRVVADTAAGNSITARQSLLHCLSSYADYVKVPGRVPCRALLCSSRGAAADQTLVDAFAHHRKYLSNATWLQRLELRTCMSAPEPLPLEAANVIAASIARYRADGARANPIVDALRTKLAHPLELLQRPFAKRRH